MDDRNENDQFIQEVEKKLTIQQEFTISKDTQVEKSWQNPFNNEERFSLINPMYDLVVNQMNVIRTCFSVHSYIAFTEEDGKKLSKEMLVIYLSTISLKCSFVYICIIFFS
jgi:hypothetical protein